MYNIHNNLTGKIINTPNFIIMRIDKQQKLKLKDIHMKGIKYKLCGIVHSVGPRNSCHFYTDIKTANLGWIRMNDLHTAKIETPKTSETAYIVMFTKTPHIKIDQM